MSGHSHWATIKRKKGAGDAKRGQLFTKLAKEITLAARDGADPGMNFKLRLSIDKARANNMPKDSIDRAIKRGSGDSKDGMIFEEVTYEGYGPKGVAMILECVTENRNRTVAEIRHALSRAGGNLGETGSVAWQFSRKAYFLITGDKLDFDHIFEVALENGADDVDQSEDGIEILAESDKFKVLSDALDHAKFHITEAELRMVPNQEMELGVDDTLQVLRVIDTIEDLDDVQNIYHNMTISEEAIAKMENEE